MRILFVHRPGGAFGYITDGMINALRAAGHVVERWDGNRESWDSFGPDLYVGASGHRQPIPPRGTRPSSVKIAIHVNPYCDENIDGINEPAHAIGWTVAQQPDVVFGYGHEGDRRYWSHWTSKQGIDWVPMPTAGDSTVYRPLDGTVRAIHIGYAGGYWGYKAKNLDKYLKPMLGWTDLPVYAHGWGDWPAGSGFHGPIDDDGVVRLLNSSKVGPCVTEPHTTKWGIDLPERLWKVALCGAVVVHDAVEGLRRHMPSVVMAGSPAQFHELCRHYATCGEGERAAVAAAQRAEVLAGNTYFSRMATLFEGIHRATEAPGFLSAAKIMAAM